VIVGILLQTSDNSNLQFVMFMKFMFLVFFAMTMSDIDFCLFQVKTLWELLKDC